MRGVGTAGGGCEHTALVEREKNARIMGKGATTQRCGTPRAVPVLAGSEGIGGTAHPLDYLGASTLCKERYLVARIGMPGRLP